MAELARHGDFFALFTHYFVCHYCFVFGSVECGADVIGDAPIHGDIFANPRNLLYRPYGIEGNPRRTDYGPPWLNDKPWWLKDKRLALFKKRGCGRLGKFADGGGRGVFRIGDCQPSPNA